MSSLPEPMFKLLLKTLENESAEVKAMFFADSEEDMLKAYQEGVAARKNKLPLSANPYPKVAGQENDNGMYSKNLCWSEGFMQAFIAE